VADNTGIKVEVSLDQDSQVVLTEGILAILQEPRDEQTIQKALDVLQTGCRITGTTVQNCHVQMGE
jgi:hypothetical protein